MMKAVILTGHGGPEKLEYREWEKPVPCGDEVLIKVLAASVNNTDLNSRTGWYGAKEGFSQLLQDSSSCQQLGGGQGGVLWGQEDPDAKASSALQFPLIQGVDVCGTVVALGPDADPALLGKTVICDIWVRGKGTELNGGFAEFTAIPQASVHPIHSSALSHTQLAAIPCAYATAENMLTKTRVGDTDVVLVLGASGGVGTALLQLTKIRSAKSIAIVGSEEKRKRALDLGADFAYIRTDPDLETVLTSKHKITACMDPVCGDFFGMALKVLTIRGRYASCGAIKDPMVSCDARHIIYKDLQLHGATRYPPEVFANLISYVEKNQLNPPIAKTFPLEKIHEAQKFFQSKSHFGKVVLIP